MKNPVTPAVHPIVGILGGMGPAATIDLMRRIMEATPATDDADHIHLLVDQNPKVPSRIEALINRTGPSPAPELVRMAQNLEAAGASALAIACNTAHAYAGEIARAVNIPLLDMVALTAEKVAQGNLKHRQVGMLASTTEKQLGLFEKALAARDIKTLYPEEQDEIFRIVRAVKAEGATSQLKEEFGRIAQELATKDVDVLVIACTELSLLTDGLPSSMPAIDSLDVLVGSILECASVKRKPQSHPSLGDATSSSQRSRVAVAQQQISTRLPPETPPWSWTENVWRQAVDHVRAGRTLKPTRWKDGARFAFAVSFDADHETIELRNGGRSYSKLSQGQYGSRGGMPRILSTLTRHAIPASFFMPAVSAMLNEHDVAAISDGGHEIGIHSWIHEFNSRLDYETERDLAFRARDTLARLSGQEPRGMRTASWDFSPWTLKIIRELGLLYDSSLMADTEPYELLDEGQPSGIVEIPVEWVRDDAVYFSMDRQASLRPYTPPSAFLDILLRELDLAEQEGGLFQLTMHPHHIGHRSRIFVLDEVLKAAQSKKTAWFATHAEIAAYCLKETKQ